MVQSVAAEPPPSQSRATGLNPQFSRAASIRGIFFSLFSLSLFLFPLFLSSLSLSLFSSQIDLSFFFLSSFFLSVSKMEIFSGSPKKLDITVRLNDIRPRFRGWLKKEGGFVRSWRKRSFLFLLFSFLSLFPLFRTLSLLSSLFVWYLSKKFNLLNKLFRYFVLANSSHSFCLFYFKSESKSEIALGRYFSQNSFSFSLFLFPT